jgi:uncharacterized protein YndB with AHSA1/START domain
VLFSRLSTSAGLAEWFADDVLQKGDQFTFIWNGTERRIATLVDVKPNSSVCFQWNDADEDEYFEFNVQVDPLIADVALIITDFIDDDEEADVVDLWDKQIEILHRTLGA